VRSRRLGRAMTRSMGMAGSAERDVVRAPSGLNSSSPAGPHRSGGAAMPGRPWRDPCRRFRDRRSQERKALDELRERALADPERPDDPDYLPPAHRK